ncbi:hypothetical protein Dde_3352 [Oleidesulfovibrio alaskensis G20]|jgi:ribosomal protein S25|uniref:Uncharacterized protein n=1 Tax=Oleidesulfovibrio alaskensis (strain ATCC BAA-1058 / DSM 17464 / G20) TaxID=207559 RepID=Q30W00_OLEA2|nr:hypothetical protein [Oleidesulfovibrio alaskensis]ABB40146.1 hypothetical protein Dde_3352 [Oleidesulfovibrio alaskensis G20]MBL3580881.1 hypothetical protein [Oleidesulfovibrio alaskensis]MBL3587982.1 hypothetical protein [bacterium]
MSGGKMADLREAARNLGKGGAVFSNIMLYQALGGVDQPAKDRIRRRAVSLVTSGELIRVGRGQYRYNAKAAPARSGELITRMWRAVKSAKSGFSTQDLARISGAGYSHALRYMRHLENDGYLRTCGRNGNTILYRATEKARNQVHAYQPPRQLRDPFENEKEQVHELVSLFMLRDLYQPAVRKSVVACCKNILARFERQEESDE